MKSKKSVLLILLAFLIIAVSVKPTLAYLTDVDIRVNTFYVPVTASNAAGDTTAVSGAPTERAENAEIAVTLNLVDMTLKQGEDFTVILTSDEGYELPEVISVRIGSVLYEIYTDSQEHRTLAKGESDLHVMPTFEPATATLTIPAELIDETAQSVVISGTAVEIAAGASEETGANTTGKNSNPGLSSDEEEATNDNTDETSHADTEKPTDGGEVAES